MCVAPHVHLEQLHTSKLSRLRFSPSMRLGAKPPPKGPIYQMVRPQLTLLQQHTQHPAADAHGNSYNCWNKY